MRKRCLIRRMVASSNSIKAAKIIIKPIAKIIIPQQYYEKSMD